MERILKDAGEISRFRLAHPTAADGSAAAEILRVNRRRGLNDAVQENGEAFLEMSGREFIETLRSFRIEFEADLPTVLKSGECMGDVVTGQIGPLVDEELLFLLFVVLPFETVNDEAVFRRNDALAGIDLADEV